jgi:hypothetical protein
VDAECAVGNRCDYGTCQPFFCGSTTPCNNAWSCAGVVPAAGANPEVPGRCLPPLFCGSTQDCAWNGAPYTCGADHVCHGVDCTADAQCAAGTVCWNGACQAFPDAQCQTDEGCGYPATCAGADGGVLTGMQCPRNICQFGLCVAPPACQIDVDCPPEHACQHDQCVAIGGCFSSFQCAIDQVCLNGHCQLAGACAPGSDAGCINAICTANADCPNGQACVAGLCRPVACTADDNCLAGWRCVGGRCSPPL